MTSSPFLALPVELRLKVYDHYFTLHRGQVDIKAKQPLLPGMIEKSLPPSYLHKLQLSCPSKLEKLGSSCRCLRSPCSRQTYGCGEQVSVGPMGLLLCCKFVYNEALETYLKSTTFCFMRAGPLSAFLDEHEELLRYVRSIIVDQTDFAGPRELDKMLQLLNWLPALSRLCIYFDLDKVRRWFNLDFSFRRYYELPAIRKVLLQPNRFCNIKPEALFILDPFQEASYAKHLQWRGTRRLSSALHFLGPGTFMFDGLTDRVRDHIRFERRDITSDRRMSLVRDTHTINYLESLRPYLMTREDHKKRTLDILQGSSAEAREEFERRFCRTHGVMLCPCSSL